MIDIHSPRLLTPEHNLSEFDCGKQPLNGFLINHALNNQKAMISRTYVAVAGERTVVGYYTLALISVLLPDAPLNLLRGLPHYPVPSILLGRFAVDITCQGRGLGRSLFTDALQRSWRLMQDGAAPARLFVVDAKDDEAKAFYQRFDMIESPVDPMRLFFSYKALRSIFEEPA